VDFAADVKEPPRRREARRDEAPDLYEILQVSPRASDGVIHAAYRVLARNSHPDRHAGTTRKYASARSMQPMRC